MTSKHPLVSVVVITYNQVAYIGDAVQSAVEQDYPSLEVIVADDGSTDGTVEIIKDYASRYPGRVVPLVDGQHLGITGNSNRALKACRGKYIALLGGDDLFLPGKISRQVAWLEASEKRVLCGHEVEAFDSDTGKRLWLWSEVFGLRAGRGAGDAVRYGCPYGAVATMVRASAIPPLGFDERLPLSSDWKLWIDVLAAGGTYGYVDGIYARYRRHAENITSVSLEACRADHRLTLDIVEDTYPFLAKDCHHARTHRTDLFYIPPVETRAQLIRSRIRAWLDRHPMIPWQRPWKFVKALAHSRLKG